MKDQWDGALQSLGRAPIGGASALWLILSTVGWTFIETLAASFVGAWLYERG